VAGNHPSPADDSEDEFLNQLLQGPHSSQPPPPSKEKLTTGEASSSGGAQTKITGTPVEAESAKKNVLWDIHVYGKTHTLLASGKVNNVPKVDPALTGATISFLPKDLRSHPIGYCWATITANTREVPIAPGKNKVGDRFMVKLPVAKGNEFFHIFGNLAFTPRPSEAYSEPPTIHFKFT